MTSFAVERHCAGDDQTTCAQVCSSLADGQYGDLQCMDALHVYGGNFQWDTPENNLEPLLGLKSLRYSPGCDNAGCGPNYCCCGAP